MHPLGEDIRDGGPSPCETEPPKMRRFEEAQRHQAMPSFQPVRLWTAREILDRQIRQKSKELHDLEELSKVLPLELPRRADEALANILLKGERR